MEATPRKQTTITIAEKTMISMPPRRPSEDNPSSNKLIMLIQPLLSFVGFFGFDLTPRPDCSTTKHRKNRSFTRFGEIVAQALIALWLIYSVVTIRIILLMDLPSINGYRHTSTAYIIIHYTPNICLLLLLFKKSNADLIRSLLQRIADSSALSPVFVIVEVRRLARSIFFFVIFMSISYLNHRLQIISIQLTHSSTRMSTTQTILLAMEISVSLLVSLFYFAVIALYLLLLSVGGVALDWSVARCVRQPSRANFRQFFAIHQLTCDVVKTLNVAYKQVVLLAMMNFVLMLTVDVDSFPSVNYYTWSIIPGVAILSHGGVINAKLYASMQSAMSHMRMVNDECSKLTILSKNVENLNQLNYVTNFRLRPELLKFGNRIEMDIPRLFKVCWIMHTYV